MDSTREILAPLVLVKKTCVFPLQGGQRNHPMLGSLENADSSRTVTAPCLDIGIEPRVKFVLPQIIHQSLVRRRKQCCGKRAKLLFLPVGHHFQAFL